MVSRPKVVMQQVHELLYQALETEIADQQVYQSAIACAQNEDLRVEWTRCLEQTRQQEDILLGVLEAFGLDPEQDTPGRQVVAHLGESLIAAMQMAHDAGNPQAAELVAAECLILAETRDQQNWELIGMLARALDGEHARVLKKACDEVEDDADKHVHHTTGWIRELWMDSLGLPARLPPPEEPRHISRNRGSEMTKEQRHELL